MWLGEPPLNGTRGHGGPRACRGQLGRVPPLQLEDLAGELQGPAACPCHPHTLLGATPAGAAQPGTVVFQGRGGQTPRVGAGTLAWGAHPSPPSLQTHLPVDPPADCSLLACPTDCPQSRGSSKSQIPAPPPILSLSFHSCKMGIIIPGTVKCVGSQALGLWGWDTGVRIPALQPDLKQMT